MQMSPAVPAVLVAVAVLADLVLIAARLNRFRFITKPAIVPALVFLLFALRSDPPELAVIVLALGWIGDMALLAKGRTAFLVGLSAFLAGHMVLVAAILQELPAPVTPGAAAASIALMLVPGIAIFRLLRPWEHRLAIPIAAYFVAIGLMGVSALLTIGRLPAVRSALFLAGALAFMGSDTILAYRRFRRRFRGDELLVMGLYVAAQTCIVLGFSISSG